MWISVSGVAKDWLWAIRSKVVDPDEVCQNNSITWALRLFRPPLFRPMFSCITSKMTRVDFRLNGQWPRPPPLNPRRCFKLSVSLIDYEQLGNIIHRQYFGPSEVIAGQVLLNFELPPFQARAFLPKPFALQAFASQAFTFSALPSRMFRLRPLSMPAAHQQFKLSPYRPPLFWHYF